MQPSFTMQTTPILLIVLAFAPACLTLPAFPGYAVLGRSIETLEKEFAHDFALRFEPQDAADPNIPGLVKKLGLTTLLDLVVKAKLADTLSGPGPFTVFGPTNDAFTKLPAWAKKMVKNPKVLAEVLKFHVLSGNVPSTALKNELLVDTALSGKQLRINVYNKDDATVATAQCAPIDLTKVDNKASNGLVHVLNAVMIPPPGNLVVALVGCPVFKTLVTAVKAANLVDTLSGDGPFTVFAPTDEAFKKLPPGALDSLLHNITALTHVLEYHVVSGTFCSAGLSSGKVNTLAKKDVTVEVSSDGVTVNDAKVISADASVSNGVVHAIDAVLLPPDLAL